jgi:hypothetical protein
MSPPETASSPQEFEGSIERGQDDVSSVEEKKVDGVGEATIDILV